VSKGTDEATFKINIAGNAASMSKEVALSARTAAKAIGEFEDEAKGLSADLRRLKGNSDDVVAAKAALKKRLDEIKGSVSALTAELNKNGLSYKAVTDAAKKYGETGKLLPNLRGGLGKAGSAVADGLGGLAKGAGKKLGPAAKKLGDLVSPVTKSLESKLGPAAKKIGSKLAPLGKAFSKVGTAVKEDLGSVASKVGPMVGEALAGGVALATAAAVAAAAAYVAAGAALAAFSLATADAYAKVSRQREALLGTAKDAGALGDQIASLAGKVPQGTAELGALAHQLNKTRISGKATVDALAAIAQVSGAVDDSAGQKIQELITRNDKFGRMSIGMFELQGTGLDFDDVAKAYADGTKKSIDAARKELRFGIAPIEAGSKALRDAAEKKFGKLNMANAFSLENAPKKFMDQFRELSKDVDLGPLSEALKDAFGQLSPNAPLGSAVKDFMTTFGGGLVEVGAKSIPLLLEGFKYMIGYGLKLTALFIETKTAIANALDGKTFFDKAQGVGIALMKGWAKGLMLGYSSVFEAVSGVGGKTLDAFKDLIVGNPSKTAAQMNAATPDDYAKAAERGSQKAFAGNTASAKDRPTPAVVNGNNHVEINIHGMPTNEAQKMQSPETEAMLGRVLRDSLTARGIR